MADGCIDHPVLEPGPEPTDDGGIDDIAGADTVAAELCDLPLDAGFLLGVQIDRGGDRGLHDIPLVIDQMMERIDDHRERFGTSLQRHQRDKPVHDGPDFSVEYLSKN